MTVGVDRDRYSGVVRIGRDGDRTRVDGALRFHPDRDRRHGHRHYGYGSVYGRPYPYAATYPYRYPYRPHIDYGYPYRPFDRHYYPWRFGFNTYYDFDRHHHDYGYSRVYYPSCGYWPYRHSYISVYFDDPVIYRYHDVYTYHDVDVVDGSTYDTGSNAPENYDTSYAPPIDEGADALGYEPAEYDESVPIEWTYDPPDGVGPPLDWAGERTPLPGEPTAVGDGLRAFRSGDFENARNAFVRGVLLDERDAYAKFLYGLASFAQRDYAVAAVSWRRAALADELFLSRPPDVRLLYEDVRVFEAQLDELSRVAMDRLHDLDLRFTLAYLFYATGEPRIASELFIRIVEEDPTDSLAKELADASQEASRTWEPAKAALGNR